METTQQPIDRLSFLCATLPDMISKIPEQEFSFKPLPDKWSKKEILGHLIDSAANNHQRFVRIQYEQEPVIFYDQNEWNKLHHYNELNSGQLIQFWKMYNEHLVNLLKRIPRENMDRKGVSRNGERQPLGWYISDYVVHMEHHLKQIVDNY